MSNFKEEVYYEVNEIEDNKFNWISRPYISSHLQTQLKDADVLFVPLENFRPKFPLLFPQGTMDLYYKAVRELSELNVGICIEENDYKEIALHSDILRFGQFLVEFIAAPLLVNWLWSVINSKSQKESNPIIEVNLIVVKDGTAKQFKYRDKKSNFEATIKKEVETYCYSKSGILKSTFPNDKIGGNIDEHI